MNDKYTAKRKKMLRKAQGIESIGDIIMSTVAFAGLVIVGVAIYLMLRV